MADEMEKKIEWKRVKGGYVTCKLSTRHRVLACKNGCAVIVCLPIFSPYLHSIISHFY